MGTFTLTSSESYAEILTRESSYLPAPSIGPNLVGFENKGTLNPLTYKLYREGEVPYDTATIANNENIVRNCTSLEWAMSRSRAVARWPWLWKRSPFPWIALDFRSAGPGNWHTFEIRLLKDPTSFISPGIKKKVGHDSSEKAGAGFDSVSRFWLLLYRIP